MRRRRFLGRAAATVALAGSARAELPAVLQRPALQAARAPEAAMLAVARAGRRLVAAGERGIVLTSDDEGRRWSQAQVPVQVSLTALQFADARRGWAAGHLGALLATTDGGATWSLQLDGAQAARFTFLAGVDANQHSIVPRLMQDGLDKPLFDIAEQDGHVLAVGAYGLAFEMVPGGTGWAPFAQRLPNPRRLHLYGVCRIGDSVFIAGEQGLLLRSDDRGGSFEVLRPPYKGSFFGVLATRGGALLAFGLRGTLIRSGDLGSNWSAVDSGAPVSLIAGIERDDGSLLLLAQNGDLLISRDNGRKFVRRPAEHSFPAAALAATGSGALVLAGLHGLKRMEIT
ncbi:MAG TPA: YCF48-related protein [Burkholderiaceae bacterium]|nr:YCF48-related protein [Burkholderiaceae bacterium]